MAKGVAASDQELALALFQQACYDLLNAQRILREDVPRTKALAVAQLQQSCEKAHEAVLLHEAGRAIYGDAVKPSHYVISADILNSRLTHVRHLVDRIIKDQIQTVVKQLKVLAPKQSWKHRNPEYPWVDECGIVCLPPAHFDDKENELALYDRAASAVLKCISTAYPLWGKEWQLLRTVFGVRARKTSQSRE